MSVKLNNLVTVLNPEVFKFSRMQLPVITWKDIERKNIDAEVKRVYQDLGGEYDIPSVDINEYDIELENMAILLDEEKNFNRYRSITLRSDLYSQLPDFPKNNYVTYCRTYEKDCLKSAGSQKKWTDEKSVKEFGVAGETGDLLKVGSPSWKRRAFRDFLIDITPLILPIKIFRISIWDNLLINGTMFKVKDALLSSNPALTSALAKNLERRIGNTL